MLAPGLKGGCIGEERLGSTTDILSKGHPRGTKGGEKIAELLTLQFFKQDFESDFRMEGV